MTTAVLDPKLQNLASQLESAFSGGALGKDLQTAAPGQGTAKDAAAMASAMLSAYHVAATVNPTKAFQPKAYMPAVQVADPSELSQKAWWDDVWNIIETVAPVVINAVSKDFEPQQPALKGIIQALPAGRRDDKDFRDYATTLLLALGQTTVGAMSGQKSLAGPIPEPPTGKDKGWFDDVCNFVSQAAPVVLPIVMSLL